VAAASEIVSAGASVTAAAVMMSETFTPEILC